MDNLANINIPVILWLNPRSPVDVFQRKILTENFFRLLTEDGQDLVTET